MIISNTTWSSLLFCFAWLLTLPIQECLQLGCLCSVCYNKTVVQWNYSNTLGGFHYNCIWPVQGTMRTESYDLIFKSCTLMWDRILTAQTLFFKIIQTIHEPKFSLLYSPWGIIITKSSFSPWLNSGTEGGKSEIGSQSNNQEIELKRSSCPTDNVMISFMCQFEKAIVFII